MKRKLIALGIISPLFLAGCAIVILLASMAGWLLLRPEQQSRIIQIMPLAPLATPAAEVAPEIAEESAEVMEATAAPEAALPTEAPAAQPETAPASVPEQALGFALPPGSVNSLTQEGIATRIVIPKLNLDAPVILSPIQNQTWQVDHLDQAVGHLEGTAPPGSDSNIVLAGHVTISAGVYGPFASLGQLVAGDVVTVYYGDQSFNYLVDDYQTVERTAVEVTYPSETGRITLITCNNWSDEEGRYLQRLIVTGHLVKE